MFYNPDPFYTPQGCPPSPPWGTRGTKTVTFEVPFKVQSLTFYSPTLLDNKAILQTSAIHPGFLVCNLSPSLSGQWLTERLRRRKHNWIKNRRRGKARINSLFPQHSSSPQLKLKRLQRGPALKAKKLEIYSKWNRKLRRGAYRKRQRYVSTPVLWNCCGMQRNNRQPYWFNDAMSDYEDDRSMRKKRRHSSPSHLSVSSKRSRSRSPIKICPSYDI